MSLEEAHIKKQITHMWDESAVTFDSHYGHKVKSNEESEAWTNMFKSLIPAGKLKILDVGCGTGEISVLFAQMDNDVTGIDLSEKMMDVGRQKALSKGLDIKFINGDAENPPFGEGTFDVLVTRHLLWTLPNPEKAVVNWNRVLRKGGCALVIDGIWDDGSLNIRIRRFLSNAGTFIFERQNPWKKHNYSKELKASLPNADGTSLERSTEYLRNAGFAGLKSHDISHIRKIQKQEMPLWNKIGYNYDYYLLYGRK